MDGGFLCQNLGQVLNGDGEMVTRGAAMESIKTKPLDPVCWNGSHLDGWNKRMNMWETGCGKKSGPEVVLGTKVDCGF